MAVPVEEAIAALSTFSLEVLPSPSTLVSLFQSNFCHIFSQFFCYEHFFFCNFAIVRLIQSIIRLIAGNSNYRNFHFGFEVEFVIDS